MEEHKHKRDETEAEILNLIEKMCDRAISEKSMWHDSIVYSLRFLNILFWFYWSIFNIGTVNVSKG